MSQTQLACEDYVQTFPTGVKGTYEERIKYMLLQPTISSKLDDWISKDFPVESDDPAKNISESVHHREEGNRSFKKREFAKSILDYNEALRYTPVSIDNPEENLSLCLANRSAAFYELGTPTDLQNALADTKYALKYGYPSDLKIKIFLRQVNIYLKLGDFGMARHSLEQARSCPNLSEALHKKINNLEESVLLMESRGHSSNFNEVSTHSKTTSGEFHFEENQEFVGASPHLSLHFSEEKTRFVKCVTNLKLGEIVFFEKPFASILIPDYYQSFCYHCHGLLENQYFFPCSHCSQIKFCAEDCFLQAWSGYHQYECGHLEFLQSVGVAHLALKVLLTAGKEKVLEAHSSLENQKVKDTSVFNKGRESYHRVYTLLDHIESMSNEDLFQYSLTASLLINYLLKRTDFFGGIPMETVYVIGGVLLRHICQLICNAHAITSMVSDSGGNVATSEIKQVRIASAIYPSASMMNHSCEPNIASSFFKGRTLVVKVIKDLTEGSEVFNCYGPHVRRMRRHTRKENLQQQYFFDCDCNSCVQEEADGFSFVDTFQALQCSHCSGPIVPDAEKQTFLVSCQDCGKVEDIEKKMRASLQVDKILTVASELIEQGKETDALELLVAGHEICRSHLYKFNSDLGQLCDMLGRCYANMGDFQNAVEPVRGSVNYVKRRFGDNSIEFARELSKLCDLLKLCDETENVKEEIATGLEKSANVLSLYQFTV